MTVDPPKRPGSPRQPTAKEAGADERRERLAAALRDNLRRRKAQQRARDDAQDGTGQDGDSGKGGA